MDDPAIPFIREYGEWAILNAASRTAAGWRKPRYRNHSMVVPEKRRYLAQNSMKRDPKAPRGARFPVRSSKRIRSPTLDDNGSQGRLTPVLPPGPFADQPLPGPSQLPLSGSFSRFSSTPWTNSWVPPDPQSYPPSGTNGFIPQGLSRLISNIHVIDTASDGVPMQTFNPDNRGDIPPPLQSLQAQLQDSSDHYMGAFTAAPPGTFQTSPSTAYHQFMLNSTGMSEGQYGRPPPRPHDHQHPPGQRPHDEWRSKTPEQGPSRTRDHF